MTPPRRPICPYNQWDKPDFSGVTVRRDFTLDALDARIAREFPAYAELSHPQPLELATAQALLAPDEALLVYLADKDATWLWTLRRDRAAFDKLAIGEKALAVEVTALRGRLDPDRNSDLKPFETTRAYELHQKILAPATPLLEGARQVFVVPDGALESLPMGVLVTRRPTGDPETPADHRDVAWLARDHAITGRAGRALGRFFSDLETRPAAGSLRSNWSFG